MMKIYKKKAHFLMSLLCLLILNSCVKETEIGLEVQPESDQLGQVTIDTMSIVSYSIQHDSLITKSTTKALFGILNDEDFGEASSEFYTQIRLLSNNINFGDNAVLDSVVVNFVYNGVYGDSSAAHEMEIYELDESLLDTAAYYEDSEVLYSSLIGSKSFVPNFTDSVVGTAGTEKPLLKVRLSDELGNRVLQASTSTELNNNDGFTEFFKGMAVKVATSTPSINGGSIIYFNLIDAQSKLTLYYSNDLGAGLKQDFVISSECNRYNKFSHDYASTTVLNNELSDSTIGQETLFIESSGGLKINVKFPYLDSLKEKDYAVASAFLRVPVIRELEGFELPKKLALVGVENGIEVTLGDFGSEIDGGELLEDDEGYYYLFGISRYMQQYLYGTVNYSQLRLLVSGNAVNAERAVLAGPEYLGNEMKLVVKLTEY